MAASSLQIKTISRLVSVCHIFVNSLHMNPFRPSDQLNKHKLTMQATKVSNISKNQKPAQSLKTEMPYGKTGNFILIMELRKKIMTFRDLIDLPPCDGSASIDEVVFFFFFFFFCQKLIGSQKRPLLFSFIIHDSWIFMPFIFFQLVIWTTEELHKMYPEVVPGIPVSATMGIASMDQVRHSVAWVLSLEKAINGCVLHNSTTGP